MQDPDKGWELHFAWLGALLGITATGFYSSGMGCNGGVADPSEAIPTFKFIRVVFDFVQVTDKKNVRDIHTCVRV